MFEDAEPTPQDATGTRRPPGKGIGRRGFLAGTAAAVAMSAVAGRAGIAFGATAAATYQLASSRLGAGFAADGSLQNLTIPNDAFPTQYVVNPTVAPTLGNEPTAHYRQWFGNLLFSYAFGSGTVSTTGVGGVPWKSATTGESGDVARVTSTSTSVTTTYSGSAASGGVRDFRVTSGWAFASDGSLTWTQTVTNPSNTPLVIGDWGLAVPGNEMWNEGDEIYETRVMQHSFVGGHSSYITLQRPSGTGAMIVITPDSPTGSGFEYQDHWRTEEVGTTDWATFNDHYNKGLNVYYVHSAAVKRTGRGYVTSTSLTIAPGATATYRFHITTSPDDFSLGDVLYNADMVDATVAPGLVIPYDRPAQMALRLRGTVTSVVARNKNDLGKTSPTSPVVTFARANGQYQLYGMTFDKTQLGNNQVTVSYKDSKGLARSCVLQVYVIDSIDSVIDAHASFIVSKTQWTTADALPSGDVRLWTFDDWMMNAPDGSLPTSTNPPQGRRNNFDGYYGLGDDWGLTHAQFLAEKLWSRPDATELKALDRYLSVAVWQTLMGNTPNSTSPAYLIYDFWDAGNPGAKNTTPAYRGYAYPHVYNTFFGMYRIQKQYPGLISYAHPAKWYLTQAYGVMKTLYDGPVAYNYDTGLMGEQSTPAIIAALKVEGMNTEAADVTSKMATKYKNFSTAKYPYGSEYSFDNTGEEAVYALARANVNTDRTNALRMMRDIVRKTRACRGQAPIWYWYSDPVTNLGESWWQFQYSSALVGYTMDDYIQSVSAIEPSATAVSSARRAELSRLNYAGKTNLFCLVNSGQISGHPSNVGASAWTYQSERGNLGTNGLGGGGNVELLNGFRGMTGESDLSLWATLQNLSADVVTDDPVFGTVGYGADVTQDQYSWIITPRDGLRRKLNFVTRQVSVRLETDRYSEAVIPKNSTDVTLTMENVTSDTHVGSMTLTGFPAGIYQVLVDGVVQRRFSQPSPTGGELLPPVRASWIAPATSTYQLQVVSGTAPTPLPSTWVDYRFDSASGATVVDASGNKNALTLLGSASVGADGTRSVLRLSGASGSAARLPDGILTRSTAVSLSVDVRLSRAATWQRIFDFGSDTTRFMYLTPNTADGTLGFGITVAGSANASRIGTTYKAPTNTWFTVKVTLTPNKDATTTGVITLNGTEVGRNNALLVSPSDLGATTANYLGRSQFADPLLAGSIDNFVITAGS